MTPNWSTHLLATDILHQQVQIHPVGGRGRKLNISRDQLTLPNIFRNGKCKKRISVENDLENVVQSTEISSSMSSISCHVEALMREQKSKICQKEKGNKLVRYRNDKSRNIVETEQDITDHSSPTSIVTKMDPRLVANPNHLYANKNIHKISPISIQVHMKNVPTNNNHILSSGGSGKFSSNCFDSLVTSSSHSQRHSPSLRFSLLPSPLNSPVSHSKYYSSSKYDTYSSASIWLKTLRLHKYSDHFEGYTFQMLKDLTDERLAELITTKGGRSKFKQHLEYLIKQGFKDFGCTQNIFPQ